MFVYDSLFIFTSTEVVTMLSILVTPTSEKLGVRLMTNSSKKNYGLFCGDTAVSRLPARGRVGASPILNVPWLTPTRVRVD